MTSRVPSPADEIRAAIAAAPQRAIPFEEYMSIALYGEHGFYTGADGGGAGRRRDFLTSPEVGPLFGAVIARLVDDEWNRAGRPDPFHLVDLGAGRGTLTRGVIAAVPACAAVLRHVAVEVSPSQRASHPEGVLSVPSLDDVTGGGPFDGVVIANELLDNLPFTLAVFDGAWREAHVAEVGDGRFAEVLSAPLDPPPAVLPARAPHGARAPLQRRAAALVTAVLDRLGTGSLHVVDYSRATTAEVVSLDWRAWLRTYRAHGRGGHYLADAGAVDITCDVMLDQLPPPSRVVDQAVFLGEHGIAELVAEGRQRWAEMAAGPNLEAMRMRSRVAEAEALLDPAGLGGFTAVEWRR